MGKMKPILFNTDMVRAILAGRKTVTRRVVKPQYGGTLEVHDDLGGIPCLSERCGSLCRGLKPPYYPGDILYVREAFCRQPSKEYPFVYKASVEAPAAWKWHPSIHMPREAARIFLRVTDVRVERLQEITESEAEKEGLRYFDDICQDRDWHPTFYDPDSGGNPSTVAGFSRLWDSTIKSADRSLYGWEANPWVWVIAFERCEKP